MSNNQTRYEYQACYGDVVGLAEDALPFDNERQARNSITHNVGNRNFADPPFPIGWLERRPIGVWERLSDSIVEVAAPDAQPSSPGRTHTEQESE